MLQDFYNQDYVVYWHIKDVLACHKFAYCCQGLQVAQDFLCMHEQGPTRSKGHTFSQLLASIVESYFDEATSHQWHIHSIDIKELLTINRLQRFLTHPQEKLPLLHFYQTSSVKVFRHQGCSYAGLQFL